MKKLYLFIPISIIVIALIFIWFINRPYYGDAFEYKFQESPINEETNIPLSQLKDENVKVVIWKNEEIRKVYILNEEVALNLKDDVRSIIEGLNELHSSRISVNITYQDGNLVYHFKGTWGKKVDVNVSTDFLYLFPYTGVYKVESLSLYCHYLAGLFTSLPEDFYQSPYCFNQYFTSTDNHTPLITSKKISLYFNIMDSSINEDIYVSIDKGTIFYLK